jgi:hypothetical protein
MIFLVKEVIDLSSIGSPKYAASSLLINLKTLIILALPHLLVDSLGEISLLEHVRFDDIVNFFTIFHHLNAGDDCIDS